MLGENWLIFALDPKQELDAESLVLHSSPKLCFVVHFYKYFWFWYQTKIVSKKVYAVIWPVLEITSLKFSQGEGDENLIEMVKICKEINGMYALTKSTSYLFHEFMVSHILVSHCTYGYWPFHFKGQYWPESNGNILIYLVKN